MSRFEDQRTRDYKLIKTTKWLSCLQAKNIENQLCTNYEICTTTQNLPPLNWKLQYVAS